MSAPQTITLLSALNFGSRPVTPIGPITRSVGFAPSELRVRIKREDWEGAGGDRTERGRWKITIGDTVSIFDLEDYVLRQVTAVTRGRDYPGGATVRAQEFELLFETVPALWREGRGGVLAQGVLNPVDEDGVALSLADNPQRKENTQLATLCLGRLDNAFNLPPASLDLLAPPGPLDWSNARAPQELADLLKRTSHDLAIHNNGRINIFKQFVAGDPLILPPAIADAAAPDGINLQPALRASTLLITSGRSRSIVLKQLTADDIEWVWFDDRLGQWLNTTETETLYPGETTPTDLGALRLGPGKTNEEKNAFSRLFRAARLIGANAGARFADLPHKAAIGGFEVSGVSAVAISDAAFITGPGQFNNAPGLERVESVNVDVNAGVISFNKLMVKVDSASGNLVGSGVGGFAELRELTTNELTLIVALESDSGDLRTDHYVAAFNLDAGGQVQRLTNEGEITLAINDASTVAVDGPFLVRVLRDEGAGTLTPLNDAGLDAAALSLAKARISAEELESGVLELAGLVEVEPGDFNGAATSVTYDVERKRTLISIGSSDLPASIFDAIAAGARHSVVTGLARFNLSGSSTGQSDVTASDQGSTALGRALAARRGAERASTPRITPSITPRPIPDLTPPRWLARLKNPSPLSGNRWTYEWDEVVARGPGVFETVVGARDHTTHGLAYVGAEAFNTGAGVEGDGIDHDALPGDFAMQPLGDQVVEMIGPVGDAADSWCVILGPVNNVDGACEDPAPLQQVTEPPPPGGTISGADEVMVFGQLAGAA